MQRIISEQVGAGATSGALECETLTAMERLASGQSADHFRSGGQTVNRSIHPLKDAPERHTARGGSHTSRESSLRDSCEQRGSGQQTARQQELTEKLSEKVQNRLRKQKANQEKEAQERANAAAAAAATTGQEAILRTRRRAQQFARARANEEAELADLAGAEVRRSEVEQRVRRVIRHTPMLPSATALPAPTHGAEARNAPLES